MKLLRTEPNTHVVATATGAEDLLRKAQQHRPGLIVVGEQRLLTLEQLTAYYRAPILLYSAAPPWPGTLREAARWGVYDHLAPLLPAVHPDYEHSRREVLRKVRRARNHAHVNLTTPEPVASLLGRRPVPVIPPRGLVVIGGSTGGAAAVEQIVRDLRPGLPYAVVVAVHLPAAFTMSLVERIRRATGLPVVVGQPGTSLLAGQITVMPGGCNQVVRSVPGRGWVLELAAEPAASLDEPNIDLLMRSAARTAGRHVLGVVLSGLGRDGTAGAQMLRQHGGQVVAQDELTSAVFGMPSSVIQAGAAQAVLPVTDIAAYINAHAVPIRSLPVLTRISPVTRSRN